MALRNFPHLEKTTLDKVHGWINQHPGTTRPIMNKTLKLQWYVLEPALYALSESGTIEKTSFRNIKGTHPKNVAYFESDQYTKREKKMLFQTTDPLIRAVLTYVHEHGPLENAYELAKTFKLEPIKACKILVPFASQGVISEFGWQNIRTTPQFDQYLEIWRKAAYHIPELPKRSGANGNGNSHVGSFLSKAMTSLTNDQKSQNPFLEGIESHKHETVKVPGR